MVCFGFRAQRGEATDVQFEPFDFAAGQQGAACGFRQQASVIGRENRQCDELSAVLEYGVGQAELDGRSSLGIVVLRPALAVAWEDIGPCAIGTAVELDAQQADGVDTDTDGALSEAGLEGADETMAPGFAIALAVLGLIATGAEVTEVTVHVQVTVEDGQAAAFDEAFRFGLAGRQRHLRRAGRNGHGDNAPLHHFHA